MVKKLWTAWEIRVLVLISLSLQIILNFFGSRRKYIARSWIKILVWSSYLAADWVATVALGNLATNSEGNCGDNPPTSSHELQAFWAPFLLFHLGGPEAITAYSLEDNELWLRHLLQFVVQLGVTIYVYIQSWSNVNALTFLSIPVIIVGFIKYGERTWVFWSSSTERLRDTLLAIVDPSPGIVKFSMQAGFDEIKNKKQEMGKHELLDAHFLFKRFSRLFTGLMLSKQEAQKTIPYFSKKPAKEAFNLVAIELGFMYDFLFTKLIIVYHRLGLFLHYFNFLSIVTTLVVFSIHLHIRSYPYFLTDICITYCLILGAFVMEIFGFVHYSFNDWAKLIGLSFSMKAKSYKCGARIPFPSFLSKNQKRWSMSMRQYNLINFCIKDISTIYKCINRVAKLIGILNWLEKFQYLTWEDVNLELQEIIYRGIINAHEEHKLCANPGLGDSNKNLLARRGNHVIEKNDLTREGNYYTSQCDFDKSILAWHIATDLCYYNDFTKHEKADLDSINCKISRCLSNYMLYLLVFCPSMMSSGNGELRYRNACVEVKDKLKDLQNLESRNGWSFDKKWEMICEVWVEMLGYAAIHCGWREHGQQLAKGGELLTHVCLIMTHLGLKAQYDYDYIALTIDEG
ncbi:uncharacterized protein LOC116108959 [Pistacia vera]|uniref:uncharacterized protein LOC116108959 n=1 Tax=Pistacia vera TaxID=55513 RepID=UPI001263269D|nr:uncharacterized protein LOC116108959 [Pistacia vera]